jgi:hypothetical protein
VRRATIDRAQAFFADVGIAIERVLTDNYNALPAANGLSDHCARPANDRLPAQT